MFHPRGCPSAPHILQHESWVSLTAIPSVDVLALGGLPPTAVGWLTKSMLTKSQNLVSVWTDAWHHLHSRKREKRDGGHQLWGRSVFQMSSQRLFRGPGEVCVCDFERVIICSHLFFSDGDNLWFAAGSERLEQEIRGAGNSESRKFRSG